MVCLELSISDHPRGGAWPFAYKLYRQQFNNMEARSTTHVALPRLELVRLLVAGSVIWAGAICEA